MYLAYLDAGSASMLAAAVVAGFAGAAVTVKVWWHRIVSKFRRKPASAESVASASARSAGLRSGPGQDVETPVGPDQDS